MQNDIETLLSALLADWHQWASKARFGKGYPKANCACRSARTSRQYDDVNGALDGDLENSIMEAFDAALYRVPQPHLTALQFQARNMATGHQVWSSPRLPAELQKRTILLIEARSMLKKELAFNGVLN